VLENADDLREIQLERVKIILLKTVFGREYIVGKSGSFCHFHIDYNQQLQCFERLGHALGIRITSGRVAVGAEHHPQSVRIVRQYLLRYRTLRVRAEYGKAVGNDSAPYLRVVFINVHASFAKAFIDNAATGYKRHPAYDLQGQHQIAVGCVVPSAEQAQILMNSPGPGGQKLRQFLHLGKRNAAHFKALAVIKPRKPVESSGIISNVLYKIVPVFPASVQNKRYKRAQQQGISSRAKRNVHV